MQTASKSRSPHAKAPTAVATHVVDFGSSGGLPFIAEQIAVLLAVAMLLRFLVLLVRVKPRSTAPFVMDVVRMLLSFQVLLVRVELSLYEQLLSAVLAYVMELGRKGLLPLLAEPMAGVLVVGLHLSMVSPPAAYRSLWSGRSEPSSRSHT